MSSDKHNKTDMKLNILNNNQSEEKAIASRRGFLKTIGLGSVALIGGTSISTRAQLTEWNGKNSTTNRPSQWNNSVQNVQSTKTSEELNGIYNENTVFSEGEVYTDDWERPVISCYTATILTRLFSSSNASTSSERNSFALDRLSCAGFNIANPEIMSRQYYRFGGTDRQRADDFQSIADGRVSAPKLLLGVRGGYGAMRILEKVDWVKVGAVLRERGTIVGGFSDVTAIQCALLAKGGVGSSNLPMAYSEFGKFTPDPVSCSEFVRAVTEKNLTLYTYDSSRTTSGVPIILGQGSSKISGTIWGGNLSVLSSLAGSAFLPKPHGGIVFIEEVGEQPYRIERMLYDMYLAGAFKNQQAIVFGAMARSGTDGYDPNYDVAAVIQELHRITRLPIYTGVGFGHVSKKQSFPMGCQCELITTSDGFEMRFSEYPTLDADLINEPALSMDLS